MFKEYKKESRANWGVNTDEPLTIEQIQTGAILRIADATEAMAKNHLYLQAEVDRYKSFYESAKEAVVASANTLRATKGHLSRAKTRIKELEALLAQKDTPSKY